MSCNHSTAWAIQATGLGKCYHVYAHPRDRLKQFFARRGRRYFQEFWSLSNVDLTVKHGEVLGIIGKNGAGKSTLLQLICQTLTPTTGVLQVNGRVAALLELGAGFNPEFTGRENIYMNAAILGLQPVEIEQRIDNIISFADIGDFIDQPVKTYSSGMFVRLAFSVATSVDPDILVIDEALSVGDGDFSRKSFKRIMDLKDSGATIIFCSHSMYQIESLCDRAIWVERGSIRADGNPKTVVTAYESFLSEASQPAPATPSPTTPINTLFKVNNIKIQGKNLQRESTELTSIQGNIDNLECYFEFTVPNDVINPNFGIVLLTLDGLIISSVGTHISGKLPKANSQGIYEIQVCFPKIPLLKGVYAIDTYVLDESGIGLFAHMPNVGRFLVEQDDLTRGIVRLEHQWAYQYD